MIESPYLKEVLDEHAAKQVVKQMHTTLLRILKARFGDVPTDIATSLARIVDIEALYLLTDWATLCPSVESFREKLPSEPHHSAME